MSASGLFVPLEPLLGDANKAGMGIAFHFVIAACGIVIIIFAITTLTNTVKTPSSPAGAIGRDYDAMAPQRQSLAAYMSANNIPDTTPMVQFQIATANFGGIFTEQIGMTNPWIGTVSPDAARMQVAAGARAIVFDIWPDPAARETPVVCSMVDTNQWAIQNWWRNVWGLNRGVGRYSNWQMLTRNKVNAGTMISAACEAAFGTANSQQNNDPFFLVLRLHGAMTPAYLNKLGDMVQKALAGHAMGSNYNTWGQQGQLCKIPVSEFTAPGGAAGGYGFVIVCPDVSPGYNLLPGVNTYAGFVSALQNTTLGQVTNAVEQNVGTLWFEPATIGPLNQATLPNCNTGNTTQLTPAQAGFCVVQPSIGGQRTDNGSLFKDASFQTCQQTGAQMVAVNLFSRDANDGVLGGWFTDQNFGKYSFKKGV